MFTVKGIYEDGQVRLLEPLPSEISEQQEVTVTFAEPPDPPSKPADPAALAALEGIIGLFDDLTPEELHEFDESIQRRSPFFGPRSETL